MKIYTKLVFDIETLALLDSEWYEYEGPIAEAKGASPQETSIANLSSGLASTLASNYNTMFAGQTAILGSLNSGLEKVFQAGANQYGFSPAEDAALRTQATEGTANTYNQALTAVNQGFGAKGGGNSPGVFSGPQSQAQTSLAASTAATQSAEQLGITQAGYNVGRQNYWSAAGALGNTAALYNPTGVANAASSTANNAFGMANTVNQQNEAASPWTAVAGILGGVAGAFIGDPGLGGATASAASGGAAGSYGGGGGGGGGGLWNLGTPSASDQGTVDAFNQGDWGIDF